MAAIPSDRSRNGFGANIPGLDQFVWYFFRVSGLALVVLALGHILITHYINVPSDTTFDFVSKRWANPLWRSFDWLLLLMALWHGLLGLRLSITDYVRSAGWRVLGNSIVWVIGIVFTVIGSITILSFNEAQSRNNTGPLADAHWIANVLGYSLFVFAFATYVGAIALVVWVVRSLR